MLQKWIDVANDDQLKLISIALSKCFVDVARDKFGNHFCLKMMSSRAAQVINCQKGSIGLSQLMSNVATLAEHQHSSHVILEYYNVIISEHYCNILILECYNIRTL